MPVPSHQEVVAKLRERFDLTGELGRGGMGVIYRARDRETGRDLALKVVLQGEPTRKQLERFRREGELTARLNHRGIVRIHSSGELSGVPFLAYELVEGGRTLREVFREQRPLEERVDLVRQVAQAIGYAHSLGVVHRDLKPANILVDAEGRARVADFGLATAYDLERLTQTGTMLGSPSYMAPEQLGGSVSRAPQVDVWALGVLLYQALTLGLPFQGANLLELVARIQRAAPAPPRKVNPEAPRDLSAVCLHALQADPEQRYPDGDAMAREIERCLAGERTEAASSGSQSERLLRLVQRRWWALPLGLSLVVLALALGFALTPSPTPAGNGDAVGPVTTHSEPESNVDALARARVLARRGDARALGWLKQAFAREQAGARDALLEFLDARSPDEVRRLAEEARRGASPGDEPVLAELCRREGERLVTKDPRRGGGEPALRWFLLGARAGGLSCVDRVLLYLDSPSLRAWILKEVQKEDGRALADDFLLARMLEVGVVLPRDLKRAAELMQRCMGGDYAPAIHGFGRMLQYRWDGKELDLPRVEALFRRSADAGYAPAMMSLARLIVGGLIKPRRPGEVRACLERAAKHGHEQARHLIEEGTDVREGPIALVRRADGGDVEAMYKLGYAFWRGEGAEHRGLAAAHWLGLAARKKHSVAMLDFGRMLAQEFGAVDTAEVWAKRAEESLDGSVAKQARYDLIRISGRRVQMGLPGAGSEHVRWIRKGVDDGDARAFTALGLAHLKGWGVKQDNRKAVFWFRRASLSGDPTAMVYFAEMLAQGVGIKKNETDAATWFHRAARVDVPRAQFGLGLLYRDGRGVKQSWKEAYKRFSKAGRLGISRGSFEAALILAEGRLGRHRIAKGRELIQQLAAEGYEPALKVVRRWRSR